MTQIPTAPPTASCSPRHATDFRDVPAQMGRGAPSALLLLMSVLMLMSGCEKPGPIESNPLFISLHGNVQGGQHPISGSRLQLYAAGSTGVGSAALPLLGQPVRSDSSGGFSFTAACPSPTSQLYLTAREGNPGSTPGVTNPSIALMAALGPCGELSSSTPIIVNEVTTVGSVWPLAPFMSSTSDLGSAAGDTSFSAAISGVKQLVDSRHGVSPGTGVPEGWVVQTSKLYSLADILDACVNSYGGSAGDGSACGLLFSLGAARGGVPPTDTLSAALVIAQAPKNNVINIFDLVPQTVAFQPTISASPADWSLPLLPIPAAPVIDPPSGTYSAGQLVTLTDNIPGAVIHYTTDGSSASASSPVYSAPFTLSASEMVRAIAVAEGIGSAASSANYSISIASAPTPTPPPAPIPIPTPGPAHLEFNTQPANAVAGLDLNPSPVVSVVDSSGNRVTGATNSISLSLSPALGLSGSTTVAAVQGIATFTNLSVTTSGSGFTLIASSPGLVSSTSAAFNVTSSGLTPSLLALSLPGSSIDVGSSITGGITLSKPAGSGGVSVMLASSSANDASVSPSTVVIPAGQSTGSFTVNGVAPGSSTIGATAAGYASASTSVTVVASAPVTNAGSVTTVEVLGAIPAAQAVNGLGFNVSPGNDWELKMAAAAGATHARFQCGWSGNENQTAPPNNTHAATQFTLEADCQAGLASSIAYGIHPTVLAAYGPPFHEILRVTVPGGAAAGSTSINVQFAGGTGGDTLSAMAPFYNTIISSSKAPLTKKHSYAGGLITGVTVTDSTHATVTLASGLSQSLPGNTTTEYVINQYLYPPPASFSPTDPSVLAYATYAEFLASKISASGVTGEVEIWNEPPWADDPWDDRYDFYDNQPIPVFPGPQTAYLPNWGFAVALYSQTSPAAGVTYNWGGTEKTGGNSMLNAQMLANTGVAFLQPNSLLTTESFHPYGNTPEDQLWSAPCLAATINLFPIEPSAFQPCNFFGNAGGNAAQAVQYSLVQQSRNATWGIGHNITETGFSGATGDDLHKARFIMRQFLGYQAAGVTPIQFYRIYDTSTDNFSFVNPTANADGSHSPLPAYTALAGLMADLAKIKLSPVTSYGAGDLPTIASYRGTYPLDTVAMAGARAGDKANSILFTMWQRSNTSGKWATLASPAPGAVTMQIPNGLSVVAVINLDTRAAVPYTTSGQQITLQVSDDPIEVLLEP
jgi:Chitobiase/beta-hexosaminidase C-terminal domain